MDQLINDYNDENESEISIYKTTLDKLFSQEENVYNIDMYQRKYSWEEVQIEELWNDYIKVLESDNEHYLGVITLVPKQDKIFSVVDGQQRLITNTLLLCVLRDITFSLKNIGLAKEIQENFICSKKGTKIEACKLDSDLFNYIVNVYNINENDFLESYKKSGNMLEKLIDFAKKETGITNDKILERELRNKYKLIYNYKLLYTYVKQELNKSENTLIKSDKIVKISNILKKVSIIAVVSTSNENIFMLFNSLNNKGMKLSQFDVIRNLFFSIISRIKIEKSKLESFGEIWDEIITLLDDIDYIRFLKYFMMCEKEGIVSEEKLSEHFKKIYESQCKDIQTTNEFLLKLKRYAQIYSMLFKDYDESEYGDAHYYIHLLGQEACYSLLMKCIYEKEDDTNFIKNIFGKLESFSLARKLIGKSVKDLDTIFYTLIKEFNLQQNILDKIEGVKEDSNTVKKIIILEDKEWKNDKVIKYLFKKKNGRKTKTIKKIVTEGKKAKCLGNFYTKDEVDNISESDISLRTNELIDFYMQCVKGKSN